jgi:hypothetical protein
MKRAVAAVGMLCCVGWSHAQDPEPFVLRVAVSNRESVVYRRVIRFDDRMRLFHVQDSSGIPDQVYADGRSRSSCWRRNVPST